MKLKKGQTIYKGGRSWTGECPDDLLPSANSAPEMVAEKPTGKKPDKK